MTFESKPKYEIKPASGRAFKNDRAREGGKDAHFNGTFVDEHGVEHFLDVWVNAKDENVQARLVEAIKYLNIRTKKKDKQPGAQAPAQGGGLSRGVQETLPGTARYEAAPSRESKPSGDRPRTTMDEIDDEIPF